jgi:hypothetical protein
MKKRTRPTCIVIVHCVLGEGWWPHRDYHCIKGSDKRYGIDVCVLSKWREMGTSLER